MKKILFVVTFVSSSCFICGMNPPDAPQKKTNRISRIAPENRNLFGGVEAVRRSLADRLKDAQNESPLLRAVQQEDERRNRLEAPQN